MQGFEERFLLTTRNRMAIESKGVPRKSRFFAGLEFLQNLSSRPPSIGTYAFYITFVVPTIETYVFYNNFTYPTIETYLLYDTFVFPTIKTYVFYNTFASPTIETYVF